MALISVVLSFVQEYNAGREAEKLREMIRVTATIIRNGRGREVKIRELVPGDIVDLYAGDMIPADLRIISCKDLFINQATLTGESFPVEKVATPVEPKGNSAAELTNIAFMGSSVVSGTALGLVVKTGVATRFGELSRRLANMHVETGFDRGVKRFAWLMIRFMVLLVVAIFAINSLLKGNPLEALLFSLAVAVGLTPEMLPMIVAINLSKGAITMSKRQVIVKHPNAIQNFGAMNVLCTDKTGTLTMNTIILEKYLDVAGRDDEEVLKLGYVNSYYQTGLKNLLDRAILKHEKMLVTEFKKIDEIPFDFSRKIMSVVVEANGKARLIAKGAPEEIFRRCDRYELRGKTGRIGARMLKKLKAEYSALSGEGFRVIAVAYRDMGRKDVYTKDDERALVLKGYLAFLDPPKADAKKTINSLGKLGIGFKILTGDNELVTKKICSEVGIAATGLLNGGQVERLTDDELRDAAAAANVFVLLSPAQKERIIRALQRGGYVVGYLGDGINDALALKASDVGISVDNAADIARESADVILLKKSLTVLEDGVVEGRRIFGNIVKYIKMGSSSNFGNMISMTGASLFLPFLPMLPIQILLNNFLYDISQVAIPTDNVDDEYLAKPRPWNVDSIKRFMLVFGPVSSVFDFITFGALLLVFHAPQGLFNTVWFIESLSTQTLVIHIIRTGRVPFVQSKPSAFLLASSLFIVLVGLAIPLSPFGHLFDFVHFPDVYIPVIAGIVAAYLGVVYAVRSWFVGRYGYE
jgi:Mg2+-importing ATPase